jgi:hypothetical protein
MEFFKFLATSSKIESSPKIPKKGKSSNNNVVLKRFKSFSLAYFLPLKIVLNFEATP